MGVTRENITRAQKEIINYYKKQLKEVKDQLKGATPEGVGELQKKVNLLNGIRLLDYDLNNILTAKTERELSIREKDTEIRKELATVKMELDIIREERGR